MKKLKTLTLLSAFVLIVNMLSAQEKVVTPQKNNKGMWGFTDQNGNELIKYKFNWADTNCRHDLYRVYQGEMDEKGKPILGKGKYGFINNRGEEISPCVYDWAISSGNKLHNVFKGKTSYDEVNDKYNSDGKWGFINNKGEEIFDLVACDDIDHMYYGHAKILNKGKVGMINIKGEETIPCVFDELRRGGKFSTQVVVIKDGKQGLYYENGEILAPAEYDSVGNSMYGYTDVMNNGKWGLTDTTGSLLFPCEYDEISIPGDPTWHTPYAYLTKDGKKGLAGISGKMIVPIEYDDIATYTFAKMYVIMVKKKKWGLCTSDGVQRMPCKYDELEIHHEEDPDKGFIITKNEGKEGLATRTGQELIPCIYDDLVYYDMDKLIIVKNNNKYGVIDSSGKEIAPCKYGYVDHDYRTGAVIVFTGTREEKDGRFTYNGGFGLVTKHGLVTGDREYDKIYPFHYRGVAQVKKNNKVGMIDTSGNELVPCKYDWTEKYFDKGRIKVFNGKVETDTISWEKKFTGKFGCLDTNGKVIVPVKYDDFKYVQGEFIKVYLNGKWGAIDFQRNEIVPCKYDWIEDFYEEDMLKVFIGEIEFDNSYESEIYTGLYGFVNKKGEEIIPCQYSYAGGFYKGKVEVVKGDKRYNIDSAGEILNEIK